MKKIIPIALIAILNLSCNAQERKNKNEKTKDDNKITQEAEKPEGTWKVNKEFDENGNLTRYDSIYSWSSVDINELALQNPDSLLRSFQSRFYQNFSSPDRRGFEDLFASDSLFTKKFFSTDFFNSEFGEDFMDIDRMRNRMKSMQKEFLEKYQSEFEKLENEDAEKNN